MSEAKFEIKEAIDHGWAMAKKYLKTILLLIVVYFACNLPGEVMHHFAGERLYKFSAKEQFKTALDPKQLYEYLESAGYIDTSGNIYLTNVSSAEDLTLPDWAERERRTIYETLHAHSYRLPFPLPVYFALAFLLWVLQTVMSIGAMKTSLMMSRDQQPSISDLFSNLHLVIPYLLASLCCGLAVTGGFILLIVPGIIFMLMFSMYPFLIIDKKMGPIEVLKRSRVITKGSRGRIAMFWLVLCLYNIVGLLCLVVGVFFTLSLSYIACAYVYDRLEKDQEAKEGGAVVV